MVASTRRDEIDQLAFEVVGGLPLAALVGLTVWMFRDLKADIRELRSDTMDMRDGQQRPNELLVSLANHRDGDDGSPYFNLPGGSG